MLYSLRKITKHYYLEICKAGVGGQSIYSRGSSHVVMNACILPSLTINCLHEAIFLVVKSAVLTENCLLHSSMMPVWGL